MIEVEERLHTFCIKEIIMVEYEIFPMVLGILPADKSIMTYLAGCGTRVELGIVSFYIKGGDQTILVDTGAYTAGLEKYFPLDPLIELQSLETALGKHGLRPEDVDIVIQTHLHWDHVANTSKCKCAKVIVQEEELKFALAPHPLEAGMYGPEMLAGLDFRIVRGDVDLCDGIRLLLTPGHTPGTQSVAINTSQGTAIIAGFCSTSDTFTIAPEDLQAVPSRLINGPGIHIDAIAAYDNALRVKCLADILVPPHDISLAKVNKIP